MKKMYVKIMLLPALLCCFAIAVKAQNQQPASALWSDIPELSLQVPEKSDVELPAKFRLLELRIDPLKAILQQAPPPSPAGARNSRVLLEVPLPDGSFQQFKIVNAPVMHPDLARKFPEINSYAGLGVQDPTAKIYFDLSPLGFHAIILSAGKPPVIIEPVHSSDTEHYLNYYQTDYSLSQGSITCTAPSEPGLRMRPGQADAVFAGDCQLRTYRIAIATTAEFTAAAGGVANTLANLNAIVTTVNGVYINELAVQLQLVANNNQIIFTNAATDGLTDGNQNTMASENQAVTDGGIGAANYDIGHALGTNSASGASGVSLQIGNVCTGTKANGATISSAVPIPVGGGIATLLMHEWGHQFGANHTFNDNTSGLCNPGQQNAGTAYEPGSGSTIMSYGGTCAPNDVQNFRDRYFHAISLQEIGNYVTAGAGNGCPVTTPLPNNAPNVNAPAVAVFNLPVSTPFMLTATASDPDGDALTFCWEQWNNELITQPPLSTAPNGPVFRTFLPVASPTRVFPNLTAILAGTTPTWEVLPSVSRTMDFRVTARDNAPGGGCTDEDNVALEFFSNAGPFRVTAPASGACFAAEGPMTVNWDVAGTNAGDVNCANVDIMLSTDGGLTFPITLIAGTPNDGTQDVSLPDLITNQGRVMVKCSDNIFFNISPGDFDIECISNLVVTDNPASGTYEARQQVSTSGTVTVQAFTSAEFLAGVEVLLNPGFSALLNSDFLARIQPCQACVGIKPEKSLAHTKTENPNVYIQYLRQEMERNAAHQSIPTMGPRAYPNPFDQDFTLEFDMTEAGSVSIQLIDITGSRVRMVYQQDYLDAGFHQAPVSAHGLPSGVYDCRVVTDGTNDVVRVVKLR